MLAKFFTRGFLVRLVVLAVVLGTGGIATAALVMWSGVVSFAATSQDPRWLYRIIHGSFKQSVAFHAPADAPDDLDDPGRIALGAQHYAQNCVRCHGGPDLGQNPMALAMKPTPQHLPAVVDQFTDQELFWILQNGVMMSAMPFWPAESRTDEVWSMVAFVRQLDEMTSEEYLALVTPEPTEYPTVDFGSETDLAEMDFRVERFPRDEHLYAAPTGGFADYALAGVPIAQCSTCHGTDGSGAPTMGEAPNLTLQSPEYIRAALHSYATGERKSGYMQVVASQLSASQIDELGTYYGETLPDVTMTEEAAAHPDVLEAGALLASNGRPVDNIPACLDCHGAADRAGDTEILVPAIGGQSKVFLTRQLRQFRADGRGQTSVWSPMMGVAHELTDADIDAVSAYFASLEPGAEWELAADAPPPTLEQIEIAEDYISRVCSECHTDTLNGVPSGRYPGLTLQTASYLQRMLYAFHTNERDNSQMHETARIMSQEQMDAVANYIGTLPPQPSAAAPDLPGDPDAGALIATNGLPERGIPACLTCHGPSPTGELHTLPRLHGQNATYVASRLDYFQTQRAAERGGINPMPMFASRMTDDELADVASWFAIQEPLPKVYDMASDQQIPAPSEPGMTQEDMLDLQ